jgi:inactivated superfamily I helicase
MGNNNFNSKNFDSVLHASKIDRDALEKAAKSGNADALVNSLSAEDKQKLNSLLNDKKALEAMLNSPQAIAILKMLSGGKKNG